MSKLNLSSVRSTVNDNASKQDICQTKFESNVLTDPDDEHYCEYRDEIWKNLLEQDAEKPIIHLQSPQLEFRGALVQQLRDVTKKLGLTVATLHSAVAQLDLFMDAHRLRADRLTHVALACLSLAAKNEEKISRAPTLKTLSKISGVQLCGKTFRQLEWMVGQHTLQTRWCQVLEAYLDLTLSDVRLKVVECVDVGCACVACARADLGLSAWPAWLAGRSGRSHAHVAPIARLLQRMMQILKSREAGDSEIDQGYSSARTSPNITPCTSPQYQISPASSTCSTSSRSYLNVDTSYRQRPVRQENPYAVLDLDNNTPILPNHDYYIPTIENCQRVNNPSDYRYCRASRLIDYDGQQSTSMAVKRGLDGNVDLDRKRYRLTSQMSQVVL
ncbi:unnamed protein product [Danaus chrysippus]|uniref:(African queen) hypothetical protein n=1 Tax=Danaus chrysippus TaxID=151541 RepID=A0A8J2QRI8_9NEOP|nr:unnamed protein product [Danaus chrysippus]